MCCFFDVYLLLRAPDLQVFVQACATLIFVKKESQKPAIASIGSMHAIPRDSWHPCFGRGPQTGAGRLEGQNESSAANFCHFDHLRLLSSGMQYRSFKPTLQMRVGAKHIVYLWILTGVHSAFVCGSTALWTILSWIFCRRSSGCANRCEQPRSSQTKNIKTCQCIVFRSLATLHFFSSSDFGTGCYKVVALRTRHTRSRTT